MSLESLKIMAAGGKILVIDDEQSTLSMLRLLLQAMGYTVLTASSGESALEIFSREAPPLVLTDIRMPGLNGLDVLKHLKQLDANVEVIVITGHGDMELAIQCLQLEASDFINKPIQKDALEVALKRAKEKIRLKRRLQEYTENLESRVKEATAELAMSCERLKTLCELSQSVSEMPSLAGIIELLKERIGSLTSLHCYALLLLNSRQNGFVKDNLDRATIRSSEDLINIIRELDNPKILKAEEAHSLLSLPQSEEKETPAMFPISRKDEPPVGAALIGVPPQGASEDEIRLISFLLSQAAGSIRRAVAQEEELETLRRIAGVRDHFGDLIGRHEKMEQVYKLVASVADSDATVLIQGESGTGKELIARRIHELSGRRGRPFIAINCAAYPQTLLESELFGYEKGAFTGATHTRKGSFELAHTGTVFLDEVGEISQAAQVKLLRVLQFKEFQRLGSETMLKVDLRILAATSRNLRKEIEQGNFREDLYYRLHVIPVVMPPLRERMSDLPLLVTHFIRKFSERSTKRVQGIDPRAMDILMNFHWPGNIRELENVIEHAFILARGDSIGPRDLPAYLQETQKTGHSSSEELDEVEKQHLMRVLKQCNGNKIQAARRLGISRSTLYRKLDLYGLSQ